MGSLARKEKEECTHFYLSILIESTKNVFECMEQAYELISSRVKSFSCPPSHKKKKIVTSGLKPSISKMELKSSNLNNGTGEIPREESFFESSRSINLRIQ